MLCTAYTYSQQVIIPDCKVHGANMGPIWGRQDPGGPHAGPMNFAILDTNSSRCFSARIKLLKALGDWDQRQWRYT